MEAEKRTAYLGLKLIYVKMRGKADQSIPHGQFQNWIAEKFPKIPYRSAAYCMAKATSLCERMGWKLEALPEFSVPPHRLLLDAPKDLPAKAQKEKQLLLELVEMRGDFQPTSEYKQVKKGDDLGEQTNKLGRRKGEGGATKLQRANADELTRRELLNEERTWMIGVEEKIRVMIGDNRFVEHLGADYLKDFDEWLGHARGHIKNL